MNTQLVREIVETLRSDPALAHAGAYGPRARELIMAAREDADREVRNAAAGGLSNMDADALYAGRVPMPVALDRSLATESRLTAMGHLKVNSRDPLWREQILTATTVAAPVVVGLGFLLYFMAGHAGGLDTKETLQHAVWLWAATEFYAVTGWGLH